MATFTGTPNDDVLYGTNGPDTIDALAGKDVLEGFGGDDTLNGGDGNDYIDGGSGVDRMAGGIGNDLYWVDDPFDVVIEAAGAGQDTIFVRSSYTLAAGASIELMQITAAGGAFDLTGNELANKLYGSDQDNILTGGRSGDVLEAFAGNDTLYGGTGSDYLNGGAGNDLLIGDDDRDTMKGGTGDDTYWVDSGDVLIEAQDEGFDIAYVVDSFSLTPGAHVELVMMGLAPPRNGFQTSLTGNELGNTLYGNNFGDILNGVAGDDVLEGFGGKDGLIGGAGNDYLSGGDDEDSMNGGPGDDIIYGGSGNDVLRGESGTNTLVGGTDADLYQVGSATDIIFEKVGEGNDTVSCTVSYLLTAGAEVENLIGDGGVTNGISLTGNEFANNIRANNNLNNNVLDGGLGGDTLSGGGGKDMFKFSTGLESGNIDTITNFDHDTIALDHGIFSTLGTGSLAPNVFVVGTAAADADDRIIYDPTGGALFYDADGNGAGAAVQFATLTNAPALTAADFVVI